MRSRRSTLASPSPSELVTDRKVASRNRYTGIKTKVAGDVSVRSRLAAYDADPNTHNRTFHFDSDVKR
ncbi:hypothetical protein EVAR_37377_1 [Eumeta japonica]|uniref:Uncharacterized protein n=1 Tax=Eumeta variegata TaxID=151549 RepID=A0A4C1ZUN3_EUMVA|nr:hypothetical protein EVAR_37377_1 [Eumeta japonica]